MLPRQIKTALKRYLKSFPIVLVHGSRQVGKTTLIREILGEGYQYILLEDPDQRQLAIQDPKRFLAKNPPPVIFDEFQNAPELVNYLQGLVDKKRSHKGQIVLTGSQNFLMMEQISQSLAGRVGILTLYGLSSDELPVDFSKDSDDLLGKILIRGTYPELWNDSQIEARDWYSSYVQTYLERDVRKIVNVDNMALFERFIQVCASRTGTTMNLSSMASDCGVGPSTIERWLSVLQATFLIRLVQPYYANMSSRIRKAPKLYFMDTGLAAYLMGFRNAQGLLNSPQYGQIFETLFYSNFIKKCSSNADIPNHYYLETKSKVGVDFIVEREQ